MTKRIKAHWLLSILAKFFRHLKSLWQILAWKITNIMQIWLKLSEFSYICYSFLRSPCCFYKSFFYSQIILCSPWLSQFLYFFISFSIVKCLSFSDVFQVIFLFCCLFFHCFFSNLFNCKNMYVYYSGYMFPLKKQELVYPSKKFQMAGILWTICISTSCYVFDMAITTALQNIFLNHSDVDLA